MRCFKIEDLEDYYYLRHPSRLHHKFNGPYFEQETEEQLKKLIEKVREKLLNNDKAIHQKRRIIADQETDQVIGEVTCHWRSQETLWMEIGIVVFNEQYWGKGIGFQALPMWIDEVFCQYPEIVRLGLSTWSGNTRMVKLAEKTGLKCEAVYRKARIVEGQYYDSVSYGILREEWLNLRSKD